MAHSPGLGTPRERPDGRPATRTSHGRPHRRKSPSAYTTAVSSAPLGSASGYDRKAWRQIKAGTAQTEVLRLLGEPTRRMSMAGRTAWYYRYPDAGPGSVFFNDGGTVSSLQSP